MLNGGHYTIIGVQQTKAGNTSFISNVFNAVIGDAEFYKNLKHYDNAFYQAFGIICFSFILSIAKAFLTNKSSLFPFPFTILMSLFIWFAGWALSGYFILVYGKQASVQEHGQLLPENNINFGQAVTIAGFCFLPSTIILFFNWLPGNVTNIISWIPLIWEFVILYIAMRETFNLKTRAFGTAFIICFWYRLFIVLTVLLFGYLFKDELVQLNKGSTSPAEVSVPMQ